MWIYPIYMFVQWKIIWMIYSDVNIPQAPEPLQRVGVLGEKWLPSRIPAIQSGSLWSFFKYSISKVWWPFRAMTLEATTSKAMTSETMSPNILLTSDLVLSHSRLCFSQDCKNVTSIISDVMCNVKWMLRIIRHSSVQHLT